MTISKRERLARLEKLAAIRKAMTPEQYARHAADEVLRDASYACAMAAAALHAARAALDEALAQRRAEVLRAELDARC